jgi:predicted dehydrogenase
MKNSAVAGVESHTCPSESAPPVRVGVIGYGYWGPNLARNFMETAGCEVAAVCDARAERLAVAARRHPTSRFTKEPEDLFGDMTVDAVAIATPVSTHYELALAAIRAGKHVLVEKPLALSTAQADQLIDEADRASRVLMVDHTFVYTSAVRLIRDLVRSGELGRVYYYDSVRINLGLFQHDVNVLWDLAVHDLAILDHVLGNAITGVSAVGLSHLEGQPENIAYLTLMLSDNVIAHLHVNWLAPVKIRRTVLSGSRKMVVYDDLEPGDKVKIYESGADLRQDEASVHRMLVSYRTGEMRAPRLDPGEALQAEILHFLDCIRSGRTPMTDGRAGRRVIRILEAAQRSIAEGSRLIALEG